MATGKKAKSQECPDSGQGMRTLDVTGEGSVQSSEVKPSRATVSSLPVRVRLDG